MSAPTAPTALRVAAFDPSTSCTGFAAGDVDTRAVKVAERGRVRPTTSAAVERRIDETAAQVDDLFAAWWEARGSGCFPRVVIVEAPKKPQHREQGRASLWSFARGVGAVEAVVALWARRAAKDGSSLEIVRADPNDWTRIEGANWSKRQRLALVGSVCPEYLADLDAGKDPGGDVGDAIALLLLWSMRSRTQIAAMLAQPRQEGSG
jgi:hypothetical protein